ncbi:MAG TPA: DUF1360 domain-containing protein [Candidatus Limnocylindria bacterium]|nr:DUF1360 domain-containing protein [Candidatus Limnocylindria bacterium]
MTDRSGRDGRVLKLALIGSFLGSGALASLPSLVRRRPRTGPMQLLMLGTAAYRIGRMVAFERVAVPLREPFTATVPDSSGAGETVVARGRGPQWVLGELLSCPICVATWAASGLFIGLGVVPRYTQTLLTVLTATGIAEVLNQLVEALTWSAEKSRADTGNEIAR